MTTQQKPITTDTELFYAVDELFNNGKYQPWYHSFKGESFNITSTIQLFKQINKVYDERIKNEFNQSFTFLECLGSNLVTDAMDPDDSNPYENWEDTPQVDILNAIDKYVHNPKIKIIS